MWTIKTVASAAKQLQDSVDLDIYFIKIAPANKMKTGPMLKISLFLQDIRHLYRSFSILYLKWHLFKHSFIIIIYLDYILI